MGAGSREFNRVLGVIPARYASTRLPGKPLAKIMGRPMVEWVYEAAKKVLPQVLVATDDYRIRDAVKGFGGDAMLTPNDCTSGTDRMAFVASKIPASYYVNIQGDEPLMNSETIRETTKLAMKKRGVATAATNLKEEEKQDPSAVKVVLDANGRALYFSRSLIPYEAHGATKGRPALKHLGLYVYPRAQLMKFVKWAPTELEQTEKLEQLRALYHGLPIYVCVTAHDSIGVDTPLDLKRVTELMKKK